MKTADLEVGKTYIEPIASGRGGFNRQRTVFKVVRKATQGERAEMGARWDVTKTIEVEAVGRWDANGFAPIVRREGANSTAWVQPAKLAEPFDVEEAIEATERIEANRSKRRTEAGEQVERIKEALANLGLPEDFPTPELACDSYRPDRIVKTPNLRLTHFIQLAEAIETILEDR